ncbi:hypothetical protein [Terrabacter carboxydivorans]
MGSSPPAGPPPGGLAVASRVVRRRRRLQVALAAVVTAAGVCLPLLTSLDGPPREWGFVVLLGHTLLAALVVLVVGMLLLALGRIRPTAAALGQGAVLGTLLGGLLWAVLVIVLPGPPPEPLPHTPTQPSLPTSQGSPRAVAAPPTGSGQG